MSGHKGVEHLQHPFGPAPAATGPQFVAADDKIKFWLEMNSIVDIFTIPPTFVSFYLKSNWLGLRFLRALRLLELPQILQILQVMKTRFIVVCGNITVDSVTAFLRNFLRHRSGEINTEIVFLGEMPPSLELETLFKCYLAYTTFVSGSALKWEDLKRAAVFPKQPWQKYFLNGLKNKILTQRLSNDFAGMCFPEVSRICFVKMNLMLIAIQYDSLFTSGYSGLILNPPAHVKLHKNTLGFFIAESPKEVRRAAFYCYLCHHNVHNPELIEKCCCSKVKTRQHSAGSSVRILKNTIKHFKSRTVKRNIFPVEMENKTSTLTLNTRDLLNDTEQDSHLLDSSGLFHWSKSTPLEKAILKRTDKPKFRNHIVACIFGDAHSTLMGLRNFVMPLRASNYSLQELKDIVFIGSLDYLQKEWRFLRNFPRIFILPGSALYLGDLQAVNIEECAMCAVLSPPSKPSSSPTLVDTEAILATLNIRSLWISPSAQRPSVLENPSNIHFIEQLGGLEESLPGTNLHLSTSFSTGAVFSSTFMDSLLATAFYNYHVLELLQMLVTGGVSSQLEHHLDKEKVEMPESCTTSLCGRTRCKMGLLALHKPMLSDVKPKDTFGQLFCGSLDSFGVLCVGLYRMIAEEEFNPEHRREVC
ncbi:Potassium channel subfamily U member 1 [Tupaia chinensis]|uniref:Potassium channel subfamily U member 1 n=1 Tax=Tupaia chinensis TaxID=246437 RepID=M0QT15_TUPCH|nr:Potassium channel subfamily U member 1 [Tupaia chinensis]